MLQTRWYPWNFNFQLYSQKSDVHKSKNDDDVSKKIDESIEIHHT